MVFAAELFTYLLLYLHFALTSIENQQYLNFKKQTEKILAMFCKNTNGKHIEPKTTMFCLSFILFCKNILFISVEDHIIMRTKEKKNPYWNYAGVKYLQHFHLVERNKWRHVRQLQNSLPVCSRFEWKFLIFFNTFTAKGFSELRPFMHLVIRSFGVNSFRNIQNLMYVTKNIQTKQTNN